MSDKESQVDQNDNRRNSDNRGDNPKETQQTVKSCSTCAFVELHPGLPGDPALEEPPEEPWAECTITGCRIDPSELGTTSPGESFYCAHWVIPEITDESNPMPFTGPIVS